MKKFVLEVGNCDADHLALRALLSGQFDVDLHRAHSLPETLDALRQRRFDLVLINRVIDRDGSDGVQIVRAIQADPQLANPSPPLMLISNYEDAQNAAVAAGAVRGFGKAQLASDDTVARLRIFLTNPTSST